MPILETVGPLRAAASAPGRTPNGVAALRKHGRLPMPALEWNAEVERETAHLYERVKNVIPAVEWPFFAPYIKAINALKKQRNAVILAHNYQTPEIYHCVADFVGDSLQLAREATKVNADVIVQAGVHFMAETAKILNPEKTVLIPDVRAGCSLASSITADDVRLLRERFPGVPVVTYVNTSAEVKAESDICCTSSNARAGGREPGRRARHHAARRVPSEVRRLADQGEDHRLEGPLRGARALHRRRAQRGARQRSFGADHRASGMPARCDRGSRLHRLDRAHDRLRAAAASRSAW